MSRHSASIESGFTYSNFSSIGRTLHEEDAIICHKIKEFISCPVHKHAKTNLSKVPISVLWFGATRSNPSEHDWYGNINYRIGLKQLLDTRFSNYFETTKLQMYYVDYVQFPYSYSARIFITKNACNVPESSILLSQSVIRDKGFPIYKDNFGNYYEAKKLNGKAFHVEFVIDASDDMSSWLYKSCSRVAVNHLKANKRGPDGYIKGICHKHNKFRMQCPTDVSAMNTEISMSNKIPGFFSSKRYEYDSDSYSDEDTLSAFNKLRLGAHNYLSNEDTLSEFNKLRLDTHNYLSNEDSLSDFNRLRLKTNNHHSRNQEPSRNECILL